MQSNSPRQPNDLRFCLDANLSYRVSDALKTVRLPFLHVSQIPGFGSETVGRSPAEDENIAKWCAATGYVLVTVDRDLRGRNARTELLANVGAETIVLGWQPSGLEEQHLAITNLLPKWREVLVDQAPGGRVWLQRRRGLPRIQT